MRGWLEDLERELRERWHLHAASQDCVVCGADHTKFYVEGHHVIYRQHLEKELGKPDAVAKDRGDEHAECVIRLLWDLRNCLPLCRLCHTRHHNARRKVKRAEILRAAPRAWQFAAEVGLGWWIGRYYDMGSEPPGGRNERGISRGGRHRPHQRQAHLEGRRDGRDRPLPGVASG